MASNQWVNQLAFKSESKSRDLRRKNYEVKTQATLTPEQFEVFSIPLRRAIRLKISRIILTYLDSDKPPKPADEEHKDEPAKPPGKTEVKVKTVEEPAGKLRESGGESGATDPRIKPGKPV